MRRMSKREIKIAVLCFILIVIYGGYNGIWKSFQAKVQSYESRIEAEQTKLRQDMRVIRKAQAIEKEYDLYFKKFRQDKSDEQIMAGILSEIEEVAQSQGLRISDMKPRIGNSAQYSKQFSISLTLDSAFDEIIGFLYVLQKEPYFYEVEEIRFEKNARRQSENIKTRLSLTKIFMASQELSLYK